MTPLRDYQRRCLDCCRSEYRDGARSIVIVSPTGSGKTRMGVEFATQHLARGGRRVVWLAHRRELIDQAARQLRAEGLPDLRVLLAGSEEGRAEAPVVVASTQTLLAGRELPDATMLVLDEAHHYRPEAPEWFRIAQTYTGAVTLGLTATPSKSCGVFFRSLVVAASVRELTEAGYLVPCTTIAPPSHAENGIVGSPVDAYRKHAPNGRAVVFCSNVRHARETAAAFCAAGITADCVDGETESDLRADALERFRAGAIRVLTNVFVLTEGWDCPEADTAIISRGCGSAGMFLQMAGRILRPAPGKARATLLDLRGSVHLHGLPGDDRSYSLEGQAIRGTEKLPPIQQCRACGAVYRSRQACVRCGARLPPPKLPRELRGELSEIFAAAGVDEKRRYFERMHAEAKARGHKPGWAAFKFKAKYGHWPQRSAA